MVLFSTWRNDSNVIMVVMLTKAVITAIKVCIDSGGSEGMNRMSGFPSLDLSESSF